MMDYIRKLGRSWDPRMQKMLKHNPSFWSLYFWSEMYGRTYESFINWLKFIKWTADDKMYYWEHVNEDPIPYEYIFFTDRSVGIEIRINQSNIILNITIPTFDGTRFRYSEDFYGGYNCSYFKIKFDPDKCPIDQIVEKYDDQLRIHYDNIKI